jgi:hypothetical protein
MLSIREQWRKGQEAGAKAAALKSVPLVIIPLAFVGAVDCIRALRNHDFSEAIAVGVIFFVICPLVAIFTHNFWLSNHD